MARRIEDLISTPDALSAYQVHFQFPLLDLSQLTDEEIRGEPILQSTLRLLKYSRSNQLPSKLREILELLAISAFAIRIDDWIQAIGVYVMAVNREIGTDDMNRIIKSVFPTQIKALGPSILYAVGSHLIGGGILQFQATFRMQSIAD